MNEKRNLKLTKGRRSVWRGLGVRSKPKLQVENRIVRFDKKLEIVSLVRERRLNQENHQVLQGELRSELLCCFFLLAQSSLLFYDVSSRRL